MGIVKVRTLSVDAFIRTMLDENAYHGSVSIGSSLPAVGEGIVVKAGIKSGFKPGRKVLGMLGAQTFTKVKSSLITSKINIPFMPDTASLGLLGLTCGLTAYAGVFWAAPKPRRSEIVVVTAAAGAAGSSACQFSKLTGAKVIGIA